MRGDIQLFRANPASVTSRLIAWRTGGIFSHVEVELGDGTAIGALAHGVDHHPINTGRDILTLPLSRYADADDIERGIAFLLEQVGAPYSLADIWDDVWKPLKWLRRLGLVAAMQPGAFDCSHLVARYVDFTGGLVLPKTEDASPELVSPNDIYRAWVAQHGESR